MWVCFSIERVNLLSLRLINWLKSYLRVREHHTQMKHISELVGHFHRHPGGMWAWQKTHFKHILIINVSQYLMTGFYHAFSKINKEHILL